MENRSILKVEKLPLNHPEVANFFKTYSPSIFNRVEWSEVLKEGFGSEVASYCLRKDGEIVLSLPGIVLDFKILKMFYSNIPYGGFVGEMDYLSSFLTFLEKRLKEEHIHFIRIGKNFQTQFPELEGYRKEVAYTHLLYLDQYTEESLWNNYKKRVRRDVRKAEKSGISIHEASDLKEIDILYDLYLETMKRNEAYNTWTKKALHAIYYHFAQKGEAKILLARLKNEIIAGIILIFSPETVYYFFAASAKKYLPLCPNDLLVHHGICLAIRERRRFFDLMTSQKEDIALMNFKEKWGAQKHPFYFYEKSLSPFRAWLWEKVWFLVNSPAGARLIRWWRGR
jgi:lipid II:glycine glycyltransferase (peptidoglycan interpeptide bridge formation enzyme)